MRVNPGRPWVAALLAAVAGPIHLSAQTPGRIGGEFQVNTLTTSYQEGASVATHPATGEYVVVWTSSVSGGTDSSFSSIQGRRYSAAGSALGAQFQVNSSTTNTQSLPRIALNGATGEFVVVWNSYAGDGSSNGIRARRFAADGSALGSDFQVNSYTPDAQLRPDVAVSSAAGAFVVVWQSYGSTGSDGSGASVQGQRYAAGGSPIGGEFQVNTFTTAHQRYAKVAADPASGEFVVVWTSYGSFGADDSFSSVQARRFDASGTPLGAEFQVNSITESYQGFPSIAMRPAHGSFVVAWQSYYGDGSGYGIRGQRFSAGGSPTGAEFLANSYVTGYQISSAVAVDSASGEFFVAWDSDGSNGTDGSYSSILGQRFSAAGVALGGEFQVNSYTTSSQYQPAIAASSDGRFLVVWTSFGSADTDTDSSSVHGQVLQVPLFADGFESGGLGAWS